MGLGRDFLKRRAISRYRRRLGPLLRKRYGRSGHYTAGQIRTTIEKFGLNIHYSCYALAMYLTRDEFDGFHRQSGEVCDYDAMRQEVGDLCFSGRADFAVTECAGGDSSWHEGADGGDSDGGFDGSCGGGGDGD